MWRHWIEMQGMNACLAIHFAERMVAISSQPEGGEGVDSDPELILEDAHSILDGLWRMARLAQDAAESLDVRIELEDLDGMAEAVEVREVLERVQNLGLELREQLDAYQARHG
jgi:hypothetical protein